MDSQDPRQRQGHTDPVMVQSGCQETVQPFWWCCTDHISQQDGAAELIPQDSWSVSTWSGTSIATRCLDLNTGWYSQQPVGNDWIAQSNQSSQETFDPDLQIQQDHSQYGITGHLLPEAVVHPHSYNCFPQSHAFPAANNTLTSTMPNHHPGQTNGRFNDWSSNSFSPQMPLLSGLELGDLSGANELALGQLSTASNTPILGSVDQRQRSLLPGNKTVVYHNGQMQHIEDPSQELQGTFDQAKLSATSALSALQEPSSQSCKQSFPASQQLPPYDGALSLPTPLQQGTWTAEPTTLTHPISLSLHPTFVRTHVANPESLYTSYYDDYSTSLSPFTTSTLNSSPYTQSDSSVAEDHLPSTASGGPLPTPSLSSSTRVSKPQNRRKKTTYLVALAKANLEFSITVRGATELRHGPPIKACSRCRNQKQKVRCETE
jgi:hypothetical protein